MFISLLHCFYMYSSFNTQDALQNFGFTTLHNQGNYGFANNSSDAYTPDIKHAIATYFYHKQGDDLDVMIPNNPIDGYSMLFQAVINNNKEQVQKVLQRADHINFIENNNSVLHFAVIKDYADIVDILLNYGIDPNIQNKDGNTPLHIAAQENAFYSARHLIQHGAKSLENFEGKFPLDLAHNEKMKTILQSISQ